LLHRNSAGFIKCSNYVLAGSGMSFSLAFLPFIFPHFWPSCFFCFSQGEAKVLASFKTLPATDSLDLNSRAEVRFLEEWSTINSWKLLILFVVTEICNNIYCPSYFWKQKCFWSTVFLYTEINIHVYCSWIEKIRS